MITAIGTAMLLAAAAPADAPSVAVATSPIAKAARKQKRRIRPITIFAAPTPAMDLRHYDRAEEAPLTLARRPIATSYAVNPATTDADTFRVASLVADDREAQYTGRRVRRGAMAAGLSLRMTNDDGVLASQFGMAGAVGKALGRIALEAVTPD